RVPPHPLAFEERRDALGLQPEPRGLGPQGVGEAGDGRPADRFQPGAVRRPVLQRDLVLGAVAPRGKAPRALADRTVTLVGGRLATERAECLARLRVAVAPRAVAGGRDPAEVVALEVVVHQRGPPRPVVPQCPFMVAFTARDVQGAGPTPP